MEIISEMTTGTLRKRSQTRMVRGCFSAAFCLFVMIFGGCARPPGVALVVGNSSYQHASPLPNPESDARAVAEGLEALGWNVALEIDPTRSSLDTAVRAFDAALNSTKKAVFFYAGHGMQIDGENYLVPVDFKPSNRIDLDREMLALGEALKWMKRPNNQLVVFLDACRDNPFQNQLARSSRTGRGLQIVKNKASNSSSGSKLKSTRPRNSRIQVGRGLAEVDTSAGTYIAYATQPGNVALDGTGNHSPFTEALLKYLPENNKDISWVLQRVRKEVIESTDGKQVPWDHSSLTERFMVNPKQRRAPPP